MKPSETPQSDLGQILAADAYLRERLRPRWRDMNYLVFQDLLPLVRDFATSLPKGSSVFDYGCGGAPYESFFSHCQTYVRADIVPGPRVQRAIRPDGLTDEPDRSYDGVLSTQVLEHVPEPLAYLSECRRILRDGGEALVTTHGMFEEHGCPHDYHRWTIVGLERLAQQAGLEVVGSYKTTTQVRGALQLIQYLAETLRLPGKRTPLWYLLDFLRRVFRNLCRPILNAIGSGFPSQGIVPGSAPAAVYVGITLRLKRPLTASAPSKPI